MFIPERCQKSITATRDAAPLPWSDFAAELAGRDESTEVKVSARVNLRGCEAFVVAEGRDVLVKAVARPIWVITGYRFV